MATEHFRRYVQLEQEQMAATAAASSRAAPAPADPVPVLPAAVPPPPAELTAEKLFIASPITAFFDVAFDPQSKRYEFSCPGKGSSHNPGTIVRAWRPGTSYGVKSCNLISHLQRLHQISLQDVFWRTTVPQPPPGYASDPEQLSVVTKAASEKWSLSDFVAWYQSSNVVGAWQRRWISSTAEALRSAPLPGGSSHHLLLRRRLRCSAPSSRSWAT